MNEELTAKQAPRSQLFLVRIWKEELGEGDSEWRGKIQATLSNEQVYFRDWLGLLTALQKMLELPDALPGQPTAADEGT